ncbi:MAG: phenylalanine--tRNA ligase subunit alpha [Planctomycetota bacterium]|jgi:phenylalanyl-tRNA synthetase alpha chain
MSLLDDLQNALEEGRKAFSDAPSSEELEKLRIKYIGRNGLMRDYMNRLKEVAREEKAEAGKMANNVKNELNRYYEKAGEILKSGSGSSGEIKPMVDPTLPGKTQKRGTRHPLTQTREKIISIFERLGFDIASGPEIEDDFHNFTALNIPAHHPARDDLDTFRIGNEGILRSQTSTVQIHVMQSTTPPVRVIAPGRVYRPDTVDATHFYSFHQIEGLAVDEDISFADLKGILTVFAKEMFGENTKTRFRPSFFPFTEPSAEMDVSCIFCGAEGCRICKQSGWIEILGCGMVDPNVFAAVEYDIEKYTGFAFGMGVERIAMLSMGINDIRLFYENDLRFLEQF